MTMSAKEVEKYRRELKSKGGGGKTSWFKVEAGQTKYIRLGEPWKKGGEVWKDILFHRASFKDKVYCAKNDGEDRKCPVCRRLEKLNDEPRTKASKKLYGFLVQKTESLWNVLEAAKVKTLPNGKTKIISYGDNKFQPWTLSKTWFEGVLEIFTEEEYRQKSVNGVTSSKSGRVIRVKREGEGMDTEYTFKVVSEGCPLSKNSGKTEELKTSLVDLDKMVRGSSDEELKSYVRLAEKLANGDSAEEDDDEDMDEEIDRASKKHKKKHKKDEEEDDDSADEDEEDEDEDEE